MAFDILLEVLGAHYLDPHMWFHLAECCMLAHQPDNLPQGREREVSQGGAGLSYKLVASAPASLQWGPPTHQGQLQCSPWTLPMFA